MSRREGRVGAPKVRTRPDTAQQRAGATLVNRFARSESSTVRWRLRNWPLRTKLLVVLLIPTLTALTLIGLRFSAEIESADRLDELSVRVRAEAAVAHLAHGLQRERDLTVRYVAGSRKGAGEELRAQRGRVDTSLGEFGKALTAAKPELSENSYQSFKKLDDRLAVLTGLRFASEHSAYPADAVLRSYSELISALLAVRERSVATISDPELVRLQQAGTALARVKDQMSLSRALVAEALELGTLGPARKRMLYGVQAELEAWRIDFGKFATPEQQRMYDDNVTGLLVDSGNDISESVLVRAENGRSFDGLDPERWDTAATYTTNLASEVEEALLVSMQQRTDALAARATTAALRDSAIVVGLLLLASILTVIITRSLVRPLRVLRGTALEVAEHRLPSAVRGILTDPHGQRPTGVAPVPVDTEEELGQVARAFDAVHGEAVRLAGEQAALRHNINAMFVNLSRRGQELTERQLAVLDRMEAEEQDPETLAGLFELDHLATRMRRNSENLLVLTGNDFARMLPGSVSASEVFGAALSEIEEYQRVQLATMPEIAVRGDAVTDVVHVISELLENATSGSAVDTTVTVVSSVNHRGAWLIEITDNGPGMSQDALDRANARLVELPEVDVEATRRMGLYVVARLAQRHRLEVRLHSAHGGGLTASILVPAELITSVPAQARPTPPVEPGRRPDWLESQAAIIPKSPAGGAASQPVSAGPPKRAPVVSGGRTIVPSPIDPHPLDDDQPTERLPVYKDLLTRWFTAMNETTSGPGAVSEPAPEGVPESAESPPASEQEPVELDPPTVRDRPSLNTAIGVNSAAGSAMPQVSEIVGPFRGELDLDHDSVDAEDVVGASVTDAVLDLVEQARNGAAAEARGEASEQSLSRSPDAVRSRMISLAEGRRRGRQARADEYAERGQAAAVGAGTAGWPEERAGS
ncbi:MAG: nitrate- and nitrite sensing domain-containing protein [Haloechinothrix sp.]